MVRDAGDLYEVGPGAPVLDRAVLLHYLDGFIDAGAAGRLLTAHLLGSLEHETVVTFDADRLIDYRSRRPPMTFDKDHWEEYEAPELAVHLTHGAAGTVAVGVRLGCAFGAAVGRIGRAAAGASSG